MRTYRTVAAWRQIREVHLVLAGLAVGAVLALPKLPRTILRQESFRETARNDATQALVRTPQSFCCCFLVAALSPLDLSASIFSSGGPLRSSRRPVHPNGMGAGSTSAVVVRFERDG